MTPSFVVLDTVGHLISSIAKNTIVGISGLVWWVVGHLILEEDGATVIAVPDDVDTSDNVRQTNQLP